MANERYLSLPATDVRFQWVCADILLGMSGPIDRQWVDDYIAFDGHQIQARNGYFTPLTNPKVYVCRTTDCTYVFTTGIPSAAAARLMWAGYQNPYLLGRPEPHLGNKWLKDIADVYYDAYVLPIWDQGPIKFIGYSAGGALNVRMYNRAVTLQDPFNRMQFLSFGSPCIDAEVNLPTRTPTPCVRLFNADDPVPLLPFMDAVCFGATWTMGSWSVMYLNRYAQWPGGVEIGLDNRMYPAANPSLAAVNRTASVAAWLQNADSGHITPHSLDTYRARLLANFPVAATPVTPLVPPITIAQPITIPEIERQQRLDVSTIVNDATVRNQQHVVIPDESLFHALRRGRLWEVQFGGEIIAQTKNKKRARGLARIGNDFLRRLQRQEIVATDDLAGQFLGYLSVASTPGSAIRPTLNPGFPVT